MGYTEPVISFLSGRYAMSLLFTTTIVYWKWGQSDGLQPRVIHDVEHTVLIVAAVYTCVCEHTMVATDPCILKMLTFEQLPLYFYTELVSLRHLLTPSSN